MIHNRDWIDPNTQVLVVEGDEDGITTTANQIHYKSLKNIKEEEYKDEFGAKSYVEAVLGARKESDKKNMEGFLRPEKENDKEWQLVSMKKNINEKIDGRATIFVAKIPRKAKAKEVWDFFKTTWKVLDIILPRKKDVNGNIICFFKVDTDKTARGIMENVRSKKLLGSKLDLKLVLNKSKNRENSARENFIKGKDSIVGIRLMVTN